MNVFELYQTESSRADLRALLTKGAQEHPLGLPASFLEKDIWVTEILRLLYEEQLIGDFDVAFKGGTALSKCWGAIERFSEDIDLSVHWADLAEEDDEEAAWLKTTASRSQVQKFRKAQTERLIGWSNNLLERLNARLLSYGIDGLHAELEGDSAGEKIDIHFPRLTTDDSRYLLDHVLLEFGGRNRGRPTDDRVVTCYLAEVPELEGLELPVSAVKTLNIDYMLWEKITALHQFSTQEKPIRPNRLSRHWYDVDCLTEKDIANPLANPQAMLDVSSMKSQRWAERGVDFQQVRQGALRIIPDSDRLEQLREDFNDSIRGGMFYSTPAPFDVIIERLTAFQESFNTQVNS